MGKHWQPHSPKADWAEDIRNDLNAAFPNRPLDLQLKSLDRMTRGDLMALQEAIEDLARKAKTGAI